MNAWTILKEEIYILAHGIGGFSPWSTASIAFAYYSAEHVRAEAW